MLFKLITSLLKPETVSRSPEEQQIITERIKHLSLYHFESCPFCIRVRMAMNRLGLNIALKDIRHSPEFRDELLEGGGKTSVPCLRRPDKDGGWIWMYESADIIAFLEEQFPSTN